MPAIPGAELGAAERLEHRLHPWTGFLVVPLFALANAGIALDADALSAAASSPVTWGIVTARVAGKVLGISLFAFVALRAGLGRLPAGMRPMLVVGVGALAGVGFTVSLFIAEQSLAASVLAQAKIGILVSAVVAALLGAAAIACLARPYDDQA